MLRLFDQTMTKHDQQCAKRHNMTKITQNGGRCRRFALLCFASHCIALLCFAHVWSFLVRIWLDVGGDLVGIWLEWEGIWWEWGELGNAVARSRSGGSQSFFFPRIWLEALVTPQHRFSCNLPCWKRNWMVTTASRL